MFIIYQYEKGDKQIQIDFAECFPTEGETINAAVRYFEEDSVAPWTMYPTTCREERSVGDA